MPDLYRHAVRHSCAHDARISGLDDNVLMRLAGWNSRQTLHRYGSGTVRARRRGRGPADGSRRPMTLAMAMALRHGRGS
jgi:hypothetical protein